MSQTDIITVVALIGIVCSCIALALWIHDGE